MSGRITTIILGIALYASISTMRAAGADDALAPIEQQIASLTITVTDVPGQGQLSSPIPLHPTPLKPIAKRKRILRKNKRPRTLTPFSTNPSLDSSSSGASSSVALSSFVSNKLDKLDKEFDELDKKHESLLSSSSAASSSSSSSSSSSDAKYSDPNFPIALLHSPLDIKAKSQAEKPHTPPPGFVAIDLGSVDLPPHDSPREPKNPAVFNFDGAAASSSSQSSASEPASQSSVMSALRRAIAYIQSFAGDSDED